MRFMGWIFKRKIVLAGLLFLQLFSLPVFSGEAGNDTLLLIDREPRIINYTGADSLLVYYTKPGHKRQKSIERIKVYGVKQQGGNLLVLYQQDTLEGNWYTAAQMQDYMLGQTDAIAHYKGKATRAGFLGFITGFAGSATGIYYGPVVAAGYSVLRAYTKPSHNEKWGFKSVLKDNEAYVEGFGTMAKRYTTRRSALGATAGFVIGTVTLTLVLSNQ